MTLKGKVALVTGSGRGIGKAVSLKLAAEGAEVVLSARTTKEIENVRKEIEQRGGRAISIQADLTKEPELDGLFSAIEKHHGRLDILVNNAGVGYFAPVRSLSLRDFDEMWGLNMRALFLCSQKALPIMEKQQGGCIVNISSLAGKNAFVNGAGYAATKWALMGFSKCLMLEERQYNIRVVTVCPGSVDTSFSPLEADRTNVDRILKPQDVADAVYAALILPDRAMMSEIDLRPTNPR
ncbi:MAG: SDR family NAD(P)-dependent oxidoreductase [Ignavibacteriales bacterium]|nr:SDR family NAD(P)-dependent oxidoreductase [Ignavibacteriales bacterium]